MTTQLDPKEYSAFLSGTRLCDLSIVELRSSRPRQLGELDIAVEHECVMRSPVSGPRFVVDFSARILTRLHSEEKADYEECVSVAFEVVYEVNGGMPAQALLDFFVEHNVSGHAWPYLRELVSSLTVRMNLPPLLLPFQIIPMQVVGGSSEA